MMKMLGLLALPLVACAPLASDDASEPVGYSAHAQTDDAPRVLIRGVVGQARFLTTGEVPVGGIEEARYTIRATGFHPLFACAVGDSIEPGLERDCEGLGTPLGVLGFLPSAGVTLWRCMGPNGRFPTTDPNCQGQGTLEGELGFVDAATAEGWAYRPFPNSVGEGGGDAPGSGGGEGAGSGSGGEGGFGEGGSL